MTHPSVGAAGTHPGPDVVAFGMLTWFNNFMVDRPPVPNTGDYIRGSWNHIGDDATIVAALVRSWGLSSGIIGTALGNDEGGRNVARMVQDLGIQADLRVAEGTRTSQEFCFSDPEGGRTYWWERSPDILRTLDTADLSLLDGARMLCVDWYDGDHIVRAMAAARDRGVPVFLNLEYKHDDPDLLRTLAPLTTICQATTDEAQAEDNAHEVADRLLNAGIETVAVTMASQGSLVARRDQRIRLPALLVHAVDACAAGATFSAGMAYGLLTGLDLETTARFATCAAALSCTVRAPRAFPVEEIERRMGELATLMAR